jgi:hypothetical protein
VLGEQHPVVAAFAQRRQRDCADLEPVVEVLAKLARAYHRGEIAMGRGHQPHVDPARRRLAEPADFSLLQDAQEIALRYRRQVADLVEEDRAAMRRLEDSGARPIGAGEGAAGVSEEVRKQQRLGERGAVHRHPGRAGTAAHAAQLAGGELLAAAALAEKEHRHVARGELAQALDGGEQQRTLTDHAGCGGAGGRTFACRRTRQPRRRPELGELAHEQGENRPQDLVDAGRPQPQRSAAGLGQQFLATLHGGRPIDPAMIAGGRAPDELGLRGSDGAQQIGERRPVAGQTLQILAQRRPLPACVSAAA